MVLLSDVIESNKRIAATFPDGLTAVFVGGTSGVGEYTVKALATYAPNPRVYIVGRSEEAADRIIRECQKLSSGGQFEFIKADISLLTGVDEVCQKIRSKEASINILVQSQGSMAWSKVTAEGLPLVSGLGTHSRTRFILNLLPLLQKATRLRRVVNVGAASCEGPIDTTNFHGTGFPLRQWRDQMASIGTLLLEEISRRAPDVSFVHGVPGVVRSGITRDADKHGIAIAISKLLMPLIETPPIETGERHLFLATSARYASDQGGTRVAGVPLGEKLLPARGSTGKTGSGVYTVDNKDENSPPKVEEVLAGHRADGTAMRVWECVESDFIRLTGTISIQ